MADLSDPPIGVGAQAKVFARDAGQVLKLFREREPIAYELERLGTSAASAARLPHLPTEHCRVTQ